MPYHKDEDHWDLDEDEIESRFEIKLPSDIEIIISSCHFQGPEETVFILYRDKKDQKLYEVHGSQCSWHDMDGQWFPEETFKEALLKQNFYDEGYMHKKIKEVLK